MHAKEYQKFLAIKRTGVPQFLIPREEGTKVGEIFHFIPGITSLKYFFVQLHLDDQTNDIFDGHISTQPVRVSPLFEYGFFKIRSRLENKIITVHCMTCERMGRQNLLQAHEDKTSNLVSHLKVRQRKPK